MATLAELKQKRATVGLTLQENTEFITKQFNEIILHINGLEKISQQILLIQGWFDTLQALEALPNPQDNWLGYVKIADNMYQPHIYKNGVWTTIGEPIAGTDLTNYMTTTQIQTLVAAKQDVLTPQQLAILAGVVFTQDEKTNLAHLIQFKDALDLAINHSTKFANLPTNTNQELGKKQNTLTAPQLAAANSGITTEKVADIQKNKNALSKLHMDAQEFTPTITHQAGIIMVNGTQINALPVGSRIALDLTGIDAMIADPTNLPVAGDQLFIDTIAVRIPNSAGSAALKWETKTNATDINVKDNYKTKTFILEKSHPSDKDEWHFIELKVEKANNDLSNVSNDIVIAKLQAAGVDVSIFKEFKGVLSTDPTGSHNDLDYYINDVSYVIKVWHNGAWHSIGAPTAALTKAEILAKLGLSEADLTKIHNLPTNTNGEITRINGEISKKQATLTAAQLEILTGVKFTQAMLDKLNSALQTHQNIDGKQDKLTASQLDILSGIKFTQAILDKINTDIGGKQNALTANQLSVLSSGITTALVAKITANATAIGDKQQRLTKTMTLTFDDGTTEDVKVG